MLFLEHTHFRLPSDRYYVNPELLIQCDMSDEKVEAGDFIVISDDLPLAEQLQSSIWHWDDHFRIVCIPSYMTYSRTNSCYYDIGLFC